MADHELIYGELLVGDRGGRQTLLRSYERMAQIPPAPHADVVSFVSARTFHERGIGWIDAHLLASALVGGVRLWTADGPLDALADELAIAYRIEDAGTA